MARWNNCVNVFILSHCSFCSSVYQTKFWQSWNICLYVGETDQCANVINFTMYIWIPQRSNTYTYTDIFIEIYFHVNPRRQTNIYICHSLNNDVFRLRVKCQTTYLIADFSKDWIGRNKKLKQPVTLPWASSYEPYTFFQSWSTQFECGNVDLFRICRLEQWPEGFEMENFESHWCKNTVQPNILKSFFDFSSPFSKKRGSMFLPSFSKNIDMQYVETKGNPKLRKKCTREKDREIDKRENIWQYWEKLKKLWRRKDIKGNRRKHWWNS